MMKLFKYAPIERIDVLHGQRVRFTPPDEFNDPFEIPLTDDPLARQPLNAPIVDQMLVVFNSVRQAAREAMAAAELESLDFVREMMMPPLEAALEELPDSDQSDLLNSMRKMREATDLDRLLAALESFTEALDDGAGNADDESKAHWERAKERFQTSGSLLSMLPIPHFSIDSVDVDIPVETLREQIATAIELEPPGEEAVKLDDIRRFGRKFGVLSLTEDPSNILMWAHYGADHSGIVIEVDTAHEDLCFLKSPDSPLEYRRGGLRPVAYTSARPNLRRELGATEFLFSKSLEWSYEREWRAVLPLSEAEVTIDSDIGEIHLFRLPAQVIRSVSFGARVDPAKASDIQKSVTELGCYDHLEFFRMELDPSAYRLNRVPMAPHA